MDVVTPFELTEMFPTKQRIIFVGNGPSLAKKKSGAWIDSHDLVIRFNECAMEGYEEDVGTRTDILVTNPYSEKRRRPLLDGLAAPKLVLVLAPQTRRGSRSEFEKWVGPHKVLFSYTPDIRWTSRERVDMSLTTGTYALSLLPAVLKPAATSVTGFTMFLPTANNHYWSNEAPSGLAVHAPEREAQIFIDVINGIQGKIVITEDIAWVAKTVGASLRSEVKEIPFPADKTGFLDRLFR